MRITNTIMSNNMLSSINKNMNSLNKKYSQMGTGKKIQMASEDPIIASRALRYRSIVSSTQQYITNCNQADSWMSVTESAMNNITSILENMRDNCVLGATDSYEVNDRKKLLNEFNSLVEQLESEFNATCMGRYVFSGYKTDTPVIIKDETTGENILNTEIYGEKITNDNGTEIYDYLNNVANNVNNITNQIVNAVAVPGTDVSPLINELRNYLPDLEVTTENGDIVINAVSGSVNTGIQRTTIVKGSIALPVEVAGNFMGTDYNLQLKGFGTPIRTNFITDSAGSELLTKGIEGQDLELQIGVGNLININLLAPNIYNQDIFSSFHEFKDLYGYMTSDEYSQLDSTEIASFDEKLREKYEHMIAKISDYGSIVSKQHANLGTRMSRLGLTKSRLEDDKVNYSSIMSDNEDISLAEATMNYNVANTSYEASLRVGMLITRLTLADYI